MMNGDKITDQVIDSYVGKRLRVARKMAGLSQGALGGFVGLTFQQIQKHESGDVRISAGRLMKLSNALNVPIEFFFDGLDSLDEQHPISDRNVLNLSKLSTVKSACMRLIAEADEEDIVPIKDVLQRMTT